MTVAEDLDLSWVTFSGEPGECCRWRVPLPECGLEAVAAAVWGIRCHDAVPNPQSLCAAHRDYVARWTEAAGRDWRCSECDAVVLLVRIEPLR